MSEGRAVSIVAVPGGYIVEYNELLKTTEDTPFKDADGKKIKVVQYRTGKQQVAIREKVDDAMKLVASLLLKRMEIKGEEMEIMSALTGYVHEGNDISEKADKAMPVAMNQAYASKA